MNATTTEMVLEDIDFDFCRNKLEKFKERLTLFQHWTNKGEKDVCRSLHHNCVLDMRELRNNVAALYDAVHRQCHKNEKAVKKVVKFLDKYNAEIGRAENLIQEACDKFEWPFVIRIEDFYFYVTPDIRPMVPDDIWS